MNMLVKLPDFMFGRHHPQKVYGCADHNLFGYPKLRYNIRKLTVAAARQDLRGSSLRAQKLADKLIFWDRSIYDFVLKGIRVSKPSSVRAAEERFCALRSSDVFSIYGFVTALLDLCAPTRQQNAIHAQWIQTNAEFRDRVSNLGVIMDKLTPRAPQESATDELIRLGDDITQTLLNAKERNKTLASTVLKQAQSFVRCP